MADWVEGQGLKGDRRGSGGGGDLLRSPTTELQPDTTM